MKNFISFFIFMMISIAQVNAKDFRFIQITDVRFDKNNQNQTLSDVINKVNAEKNVEFVVFTGDNIVHPEKEQLKAFLLSVKKLKKPYYLIIGDKDVNKRKKFGKKEYINVVKKYARGFKPESTNYVFERKDIVFIVADGAKEVIPSTIGYYKDNMLEWIDSTLDMYPSKNVVILQHFPIVPPSSRESHYTYKANDYLNILQKHKNVKAVIAGHFGVNKEEVINGISHISTAPAPYYRVIDIIDYETENPTVWSEVKQ